MIALKINGQRGLKLSLLLSSGFLKILKSAANNKGIVSDSQVLTNSARNSYLFLSYSFETQNEKSKRKECLMLSGV
jgi:hypothetical protein